MMTTPEAAAALPLWPGMGHSVIQGAPLAVWQNQFRGDSLVRVAYFEMDD